MFQTTSQMNNNQQKTHVVDTPQSPQQKILPIAALGPGRFNTQDVRKRRAALGSLTSSPVDDPN